MTWLAATSGKRGRSPKFSDAAIQFFDAQEPVWLGAATGNRLGGAVLQRSGLTWPTLDFSTLSKRQQTLNVETPYIRSEAGLHQLVDSAGIKFLGEGQG